MTLLDGRRAVVTGAARGIGYEIARILAQAAAAVVGGDRHGRAARAAAPARREQGGGSIVNISSIAGKVGNFGQTNYSAAKAGLIGLTKASAKELARSAIRVNAVQPGLIRTAMTEAMPKAAWEAKLA